MDFSPDERFFVDTWSRVDQPPVTELRRAADVWPELIASARKTLDIAEFYVAVSTASREPIELVMDTLRQAGWRVIEIWECDTRNPETLRDRVAEVIAQLQ